MAEPSGTPGVGLRGSRRLLIFMLFLVSTLNFADRAVFSALAQVIKAEMHLSDTQLGILQGLVFAALYAIAGLPIGLLAERFSRKRIIAAATVIWSAATLTTGLAVGFTQLLFSRMIVGMGEAGFTPPAASLVADVTPRHKRASAMSLVLLGTPVGMFLGAVMAGQIAALWGWRWAFIAFSVPGIIVALLLVALVTEPPRGQHDGGVATHGMAPPFGQFLRTVLANKPLLWVIAGGSITGLGMASIAQFMAIFLARNYHLGVREAAAGFGSVSGLSVATGLLVGSFGTDYLSKRDPRWPAWGAALGLVIAPVVYWFAFNAPGVKMSMALLLLGGSFLLMFFGPTAGMIQNLLPTRMRASGIALYTLLYTLVGYGLGPVIVGGLSDHFAAASFGSDFAAACPGGIAARDAVQAVVSGCADATAYGIRTGLSFVVASFWLGALCFFCAAPGLKRAAESEAAATDPAPLPRDHEAQ